MMIFERGGGSASQDEYDAAWEARRIDVDHHIDLVFWSFSYKRVAMKTEYGIELFPADFEAADGIRR